VGKYFKENKDLAEEIERLVRENSAKASIKEDDEVKDADADDDDDEDPDDVPLDIVVEDFDE